ncbi:MAG: hypothetical protein A2V74_03645 [Acidobacteria bacterium RBG_16_70_10]|nr:MAG: hypothetical protein A2V74_03645 [Acidobacteria bacterium RBG_16_70_10]
MSPSSTTALAILVVAAAGAAARAEESQGVGFGEALTQGKVKAALRYRYEGVGDDAFEPRGEASTLRLALGYETKPWKGLSAWVQFESVTDLGLGDRHGNGATGALDNGVRGRPVIADPEITQVNQALLRFARARTTIEGGRFGLDLGNERFVGTVGWRQNHQGFDGARVEQGIGARARAGYAWLGAANRVTGDRKPMSSHLGYGSFDVRPTVRLHATVLLLDYDPLEDAGLSSLTAAAGITGSHASGAWQWLVEAEFAWQTDAGENATTIDEPYLRGEIGAQRGRVSARAGIEVLGGSLEAGRGSFQTPLATLHKWNGWADKFQTTPAAGLRDGWVSLGAGLGRLKLLAVWHDFRAEAGEAHYGSEWDFLATYDLPWKQQIAAKAALYDADELAKDTTKAWLYTTWGF